MHSTFTTTGLSECSCTTSPAYRAYFAEVATKAESFSGEGCTISWCLFPQYQKGFSRQEEEGDLEAKRNSTQLREGSHLMVTPQKAALDAAATGGEKRLETRELELKQGILVKSQ